MERAKKAIRIFFEKLESSTCEDGLFQVDLDELDFVLRGAFFGKKQGKGKKNVGSVKLVFSSEGFSQAIYMYRQITLQGLNAILELTDTLSSFSVEYIESLSTRSLNEPWKT